MRFATRHVSQPATHERNDPEQDLPWLRDHAIDERLIDPRDAGEQRADDDGFEQLLAIFLEAVAPYGWRAAARGFVHSQAMREKASQ